jgi:hypothetical protein
VQSFQNETKLVWSMRSWEGNYLLTGRRLTAYPPGVDVAKILDPTIGTLAGLTSVERLFEDIPYMVTGLSFDRYRANLKKHSEGGVYLEIPMIDQGEASYCYPASMARILNYYGRNVDMLSVAKVAGSDAKAGTSIPGVIAALGRAAAKLEVYPVNPSGSLNSRASSRMPSTRGSRSSGFAPSTAAGMHVSSMATTPPSRRSSSPTLGGRDMRRIACL